MYQSLFMSGENIMYLLTNTMEILQIDPHFIVKNKTSKSKELTAQDVLNTIIEDGGSLPIPMLFKGHEIPTIRRILVDLFTELPKPSTSSHWYLHILSINSMKKCPKCANILSIDRFSKNKAMKTSGVDSWCLGCMGVQREANKEHLKVVKSLHQQNNKAMYAEASARRRARKLKASPSWSNKQELKEWYLNCPEGYHVDHWAPLQGANVCGLHVLENLQYMPASLNISKGNQFLDSDPYRVY